MQNKTDTLLTRHDCILLIIDMQETNEFKAVLPLIKSL